MIPTASWSAAPLTALKDGNLLVALEPLLRVADKHPELAAKVIETLSSGPSERPAIMAKALPRLRKFASHPRVDVRAAVVKALGDPAEKAIEPEVQAALADPESEVRIAAAQILLAKLNARRPQGSDDSEDTSAMAFMFFTGVDPADERAAAEEQDTDAKVVSVESWLTRFQEGKGRPAWMEPADRAAGQDAQGRVGRRAARGRLAARRSRAPVRGNAHLDRGRGGAAMTISAKPPTPCPGCTCATGSSCSGRSWP